MKKSSKVALRQIETARSRVGLWICTNMMTSEFDTAKKIAEQFGCAENSIRRYIRYSTNPKENDGAHFSKMHYLAFCQLFGLKSSNEHYEYLISG